MIDEEYYPALLTVHVVSRFRHPVRSGYFAPADSAVAANGYPGQGQSSISDQCGTSNLKLSNKR